MKEMASTKQNGFLRKDWLSTKEWLSLKWLASAGFIFIIFFYCQ